MSQPKAPYVPKLWPRWITTPDGYRMIVQDCRQMSALMGEEYGEDAEPVNKPAPPEPEPPAAEPEDSAESIEAAQAMMDIHRAEMSEAAAPAEDPLDPAGIFSVPTVEEEQQLVKKRRGKAAKE